MIFKFKRPSGVPKKQVYKASRPDADNTSKAALDALTVAGVWRDDSQVVDMRGVKIWVDDEKEQGVEVIIKPLECGKKCLDLS